jgi:hypothetical protein
MKTSKLFTLLLGSFIFCTYGLSNELLLDAVESKTDMKVKGSDKKNQNNTKISIEERFSSKTYQNTNWTRKVNDDEYEKGKIRTH